MTSDIYDQNLSLELAGGNPELAEQMLAMLVQNLPKQKTALLNAHSEGDHDALYENVHKITGSTRYCGVPALADASEILDRQLKNGDTGQLDFLLKNLLEEMDRLIDFKP